MTTLAVVGSRACNAAQFAAIMRNLDGIEPAPERIVTGDAAGGDEAARVWAQNYSYELVSLLTENTRAMLADAVAAWMESGEPLGTLIGDVARFRR